MGACVSLSRSPPPASHSPRAAAAAPATVKVVNLDGSMAQLAVPVTARDALAPPDDDGAGASQPQRHHHHYHHHRAPPPPQRLFLCSSDELGFDAPPRALAAGEALQPGQLYFVLPASALRRPLSARDMAALAVRAATALAAEAALAAGGLSPRRDVDKQGVTTTSTPAGKRRSRRRATARVAPLLVAVSKDSLLLPDGGYIPAARPAVQDSGRTVGKTRNGAGYRTGGSRRRAVVQRLSAIAEDDE